MVPYISLPLVFSLGRTVVAEFDVIFYFYFFNFSRLLREKKIALIFVVGFGTFVSAAEN